MACSTTARCSRGHALNTLSSNLLQLTLKLVNVQLLLVRIVNKSIIPSLQLTFKLVTDLLLGLISASHKCFNRVFPKKVPVTVELTCDG